MQKSVRWSTITVYEFGVAIGGSAIPKHGGPSIGLARKPKLVWSTTVDEVKDQSEPLDQQSRQSAKNEARKQRVVRRRRVRWFKPLERVTMLTKAGCSEKRIYRMLMECSEIAMSRRLSLSIQRGRIAV